MTHKAQEIARYDFKAADNLLLDTNIWMFIFGAQKPGDKRGAIYSEALGKILKAESRIYIDVLIVSEFINTYARLKWKQADVSFQEFKQFRQSSFFKPIAEEISECVKQILKLCIRMESGFESLAIHALLDDYAAGMSDFNDQILTSLCQEKGLKLVTHDADFHGCIPVVTANRRLLC
ncbi:MAG: PIN domain-containing protein [Methylomonas sp.]